MIIALHFFFDNLCLTLLGDIDTIETNKSVLNIWCLTYTSEVVTEVFVIPDLKSNISYRSRKEVGAEAVDNATHPDEKEEQRLW